MIQEPKLYRTKKNHMGEDLLPANSAYTEEQIAEMNRAHDERMGWSPGLGNVYTNAARLPESYFGPRDQVWSNAEVSEGGTRDSRIETAAQSRPSLH